MVAQKQGVRGCANSFQLDRSPHPSQHSLKKKALSPHHTRACGCETPPSLLSFSETHTRKARRGQHPEPACRGPTLTRALH